MNSKVFTFQPLLENGPCHGFMGNDFSRPAAQVVDVLCLCNLNIPGS